MNGIAAGDYSRGFLEDMAVARDKDGRTALHWLCKLPHQQRAMVLAMDIVRQCPQVVACLTNHVVEEGTGPPGSLANQCPNNSSTAMGRGPISYLCIVRTVPGKILMHQDLRAKIDSFDAINFMYGAVPCTAGLRPEESWTFHIVLDFAWRCLDAKVSRCDTYCTVA